MRKLRMIHTALLMIAGLTVTASAERPKMATVDMQKLFLEYHRTIASQKRFNAEYARIQKEINERREVMNRMRRMLNGLEEQIISGKLTDEQKSNKLSEGKLMAQELKMMAGEVKRFSEQEKTKVASLKAASMQGIMQELRKKVIDHAKEQGYDYVFDKSGKNTNQVSFFIYLKDANEISANMLKGLNEFAPGADSH